MQETTRVVRSMKLDETALIDELKRLRAQIPDNPSLNPILNVAFDMSRRLESGDVSFDDMKGLAGRLMDRACVRRAKKLREKIGFKRAAVAVARKLAVIMHAMLRSGELFTRKGAAA